MTSKFSLFAALLLMPFISPAQQGQRGRDGVQGHEAPRGGEHDRDRGGFNRNESSTLSIFSEHGEQFYLVLNGVNQNNVPTSKIRVEGLPQFGNDVQIMFADNRTAGIRRNVNIADPLDGRAVNMTLKIEQRDGRAWLKFFKCRELEHNFKPERDEYVMNYGNPNRLVYPQDGGYVETGGQGYTQDQQYNQAPPPPPPPPAPVAMDNASFNDALKAIKRVMFDDSRMTTVKTVLGPNYVNTMQVRSVCNTFSFADGKLDVIRYLYPKTVDQGNMYKLADMFGFDSDKEALNKIILENQR